jgi:hypothetical protein
MTASNKISKNSQQASKPLMREVFGFDLQAIVEKHPEHKALIDWLCHGAQPQYTYGMLSTACFLKLYQQRSKKRRPDEVGGLWAFTGESNRQRDVRISEDQRTEMLIHAEEYTDGCSDCSMSCGRPISASLMMRIIRPSAASAAASTSKTASRSRPASNS